MQAWIRAAGNAAVLRGEKQKPEHAMLFKQPELYLVAVNHQLYKIKLKKIIQTDFLPKKKYIVCVGKAELNILCI